MPSPQRLLAASCVLAQIALAAHAQAQHIHQPLHAALHHRDLISLPDSGDKTTAGGAGADTTAATTAATTTGAATTNTQATTADTTHTTATPTTNTQVTTTSPTTQQTTTQPTSTPTGQQTTANTNTNTNTPPAASTANTSQTNNNNQQTSSPTGQASKSGSNNNNNNGSPTPAAPITSQSLSVNADGQTQTIFTVITPTASAASSAASSSSTSSSSGGGSSGLGGGSIAGMVIAGIVGVSGIVGFLVWKLKRKRFSDFDDNEAIKWPDLNGHGQANDDVPVGRDKSTFGGSSAAGSTAHANDSEFVVGGGAARMDGYAPSIAASTPDVHDPYAVPPLPHMNPGQPAAYHDDPYAPGGYDPYRGPVPGTLDDDAASVHHPEAYQMTQIRARSPAPGGMPARVASPGPGQVMAYGDAAGMRSRSPAPTLGGYGGGRSSPAPGAYYNGMR